ncbi:gp097 [Rhodococcus phage ReqiPoco6]|uniref:Gp097 n=1 Tax=Rhodococcus phage ReqiPoco6 TaxID=691964 RepID=D4P7W5_9CAUD|nr:gp097 [Rhodococcus phage ReqiPoco6]ADD81095.1 gp097 [Rhodococcus phage ReqiPoco6]
MSNDSTKNPPEPYPRRSHAAHMPYKVLVIDDDENRPIIEDALVNSAGLAALLVWLLDLNINAITLFLNNLELKGCSEHISQPGDERRFTISAVRR